MKNMDDISNDSFGGVDSFRQSTRLLWWHRDRKQPKAGETRRILILSPAYPEGDPMRIRIIDARFFAASTDAEWWAPIYEPKV